MTANRTMTPLEVHIANTSPSRSRSRRRDAIDWLSLELIVLLITIAAVGGMFLGMVLHSAFGDH